jgi:hypothetical protein
LKSLHRYSSHYSNSNVDNNVNCITAVHFTSKYSNKTPNYLPIAVEILSLYRLCKTIHLPERQCYTDHVGLRTVTVRIFAKFFSKEHWTQPENFILLMQRSSLLVTLVLRKIKLPLCTPRRHWGISPLIPNFGNGESVWTDSRHTILSQGNEPRYPLNRRMDGPQRRCGRFWEEKDILTLPGIEPRIVRSVVY